MGRGSCPVWSPGTDEGVDLSERHGRVLLNPRLDQRSELLLQSIDHGVGMAPGPTQALRVVVTEVGFHGGVAEEQRTLGQQQAHRILHRIHVGDEIVGHDEVDQVDQVVESGPGGERQPRRAYLDPVLAKGHDGPGCLGDGMALVEVLEDRVIGRLERRNDECAAGVCQLRENVRVAQDVLHLGCAVEAQVWMTPVHRSQDPACVERDVEEVRVGEGHMAGTCFHQLVDIGHDDSHVHRAHAAVIHDRNRTVSAPVRATSTGLDRADQALLAVDDEPGVRTSLTGVLRDEGYSVEAVASGEACLDRLTRAPVDLIVLDVWLPGMDGLEATRRIRAFEAEHGGVRTPIIALTANASAEDRDACLAAGMDGFVIKPLDRERLAAAVAGSNKAARAA